MPAKITPEGEALKAKIKTAWIAGDSAQIIADRLGISRCSAIGHVWRMKLEPRQVKTVKPKPIPVPKPKPIPSQPLPEPVSLNLSMMELNDTVCRWPYGDRDYTFCGQPADKVYCSFHEKLGHTKPQPYVRKPGSI